MVNNATTAISNYNDKNIIQSVTVAGMFAIVPMVLPRMRSETYVLHDLLKFCRSFVHAVSIWFGNVPAIHY